MLRQRGVDIKTAQELLRHANSRITQDIDQQAVSEEKRLAPEPGLPGSAGRGLNSAPFSTLGGRLKEDVASINN
jgi:hypothetical protein